MFKCLTHQCIHGTKWNMIGCFACQSFGLLAGLWPFKAAKVPRPSDWQQKYCLYCLYSIFSADTSVLYFCVCLYRVLSLASVCPAYRLFNCVWVYAVITEDKPICHCPCKMGQSIGSKVWRPTKKTPCMPNSQSAPECNLWKKSPKNSCVIYWLYHSKVCSQ